MLRLEPLFSLEKDVFPRIPRKHLEVPPKFAPKHSDPGASVTFLNFRGAALNILGRHNGDTIILSYIGFIEESRTSFFATYDIKEHVLKVVYRQRGAVAMIGCTINTQASLIAFSYKTTKGSSAGVPDMYESCVAETSEQGQCYRMNPEHVTGPTPETQWLQFIPNRANGSHLLIYIYNTHADLFAIYTNKKNGAQAIAAHPHFRNKLAERLCWFQWDEHRMMIYILNTKRKVDEMKQRQVYVLRCIEFPDRKPVVSFKATPEMELQMNGMRAKDHMQIVRFGAPADNAYCLCQQHANPIGNLIRVSVWIFHHDIKLDIDIPFISANPNYSTSGTTTAPTVEYSPDYLARVRVFFDALGDLLVIYVPGVYLQVIDCAVDHEPTLNLVLSGSTYNSPLPDMDPATPSNVDTFELRGEGAKSGKRLSLLDRVKGLLYEYKLNQNTIVTAASTPDASLHKQLLALALLHVQDEDTSENIILSLLRKHPSLVSSDLMKYYLIGAPFREYRKKTDPIQKRVATLLPVLPAAIKGGSGASSARNSLSSSKDSNSSMHSSGGSARDSLPLTSSVSTSTLQAQPKPMAIPGGQSHHRRASSQIGSMTPDSISLSTSSTSPGILSTSQQSAPTHTPISFSFSVSSYGPAPSSPSFTSASSSLQPISPSISSSVVTTVPHLDLSGKQSPSTPTGVSFGSVGSSIPRPGSPSSSSSSPSSVNLTPQSPFTPQHSTPSTSLSAAAAQTYGSSPSITPSSGSLSDSPNSLSGSSIISLGSSWHQPDITPTWSGYQLVQRTWPDRAPAIQLPTNVYLVAGNDNSKTVVQARLWTAGSDVQDAAWQMEHLSGSSNARLRPRETGSLLTLARLFSEDESADPSDWFYLFQSNDGLWYRARVTTCIDPEIGPGFASSIPVVSVASSPNLQTSAIHKKSSRINLEELDWQHVHEDYIPQQTVFKKLMGAVGRIFGSADESIVQKDKAEEDYYDPRRLFIVGAYCKHIFENISHAVKVTKAECFEWASHYRSLQAAAVGKLYGFIHVCAGEMPQHMLFQVYTKFHEVLEELMLPIPNDFYTKYTVAGYFCLPRHIFIQYADHGIFQLTHQFVDQLNVRTPDDLRFKQLMLSYLPKEDAIKILRTMQEGQSYVVEDAVATEPETSVDVDLEDIAQTEFLPVGAYQQALGKKRSLADPMYQFVCGVTTNQFKRSLLGNADSFNSKRRNRIQSEQH